ncbi:MAG: PilN domain-containing protein [Dehalococcoidales bacterium]|nr:PilN domain-containing protein [Dehalococcoidales bacterium]
MTKNATTLYISDASIRLLVTRGKRITKIASVPLETGLSDVDSPEKEAELIAKIKTLVKSNKISDKKIILGISGLHCLTRPVTLPELPKAMVGEAIIREARRVLPVPPEQLYISWQTVSTTEGKLMAFMVGIPRHIANTLMRILREAGLKPYLMDIKPLALARLAKESTSIVVDVQSNEFDIIIIDNGIPQPIRTVPFPEEYQTLEQKVDIVRDELNRTVQFHNSNNPDTPLLPQTKLYISGDIADEPDLYRPLAEDMGFEAELLSSPLKCQKHLDPSLHLANVGLVLKDLPKDAGPLLPNFNTLPEPFQPKQLSMNKLMAIPAAAAAVALIVLLGMTIQEAAGRLDSTQVQLDTTNFLLEKRNKEKTEMTQHIAQLESELADVETTRENFSEILKNIGTTGDAINTDLGESVGSLVPNLDLTGLNHIPQYMALTGEAQSEQEVIEYARSLADTGLFSEITIRSLNREDSSSDNLTFSLDTTLATEE